MDNQNSLTIFIPLIFLGAILMMLGGCAQPPSVAPSYALKEQLQELKSQQAAQQQQLQEMQQLVAQLQEQLAGNSGTLIDADPAPSETASGLQTAQANTDTAYATTNQGLSMPQAGSAEMVRIADSASSYLTAFSSLASGQYYAAESGFSSFLASYPDHQYAPNARYWLANAQAAQNKTSQAVSNLRQVIADPAGQEKAPAALIQLIQLYQRAGLLAQADQATIQLRDVYGNSAEARYYFQSNSAPN